MLRQTCLILRESGAEILPAIFLRVGSDREQP